MKKIAFLMFACLMSSGAVFAESVPMTELEQAQKQIIALQQENMKLHQTLTKSYKSSGLCYSVERGCLYEQARLNRTLAMLSNARISMNAICQISKSEAGTICADSPYMLTMSVKLTPQ